MSLTNLPDLALHIICEYLYAIPFDCFQSLVALSYTSKRLNYIANCQIFRSIYSRQKDIREDLLHQSFLTNPANLRHIRQLGSVRPDLVAEWFSLCPLNLKILHLHWLATGAETLERNVLTENDTISRNEAMVVDKASWKYVCPSLYVLEELVLDFAFFGKDIPTAQEVVDALPSSPFLLLKLDGVKEWQIDLDDDKFPKLETLIISRKKRVKVFNDEDWHRLSKLMNRKTNFYCTSSASRRSLFDVIYDYGESKGLDLVPVTRWLANACDPTAIDSLVCLEDIKPQHLYKILGTLWNLPDIRLRIPVDPDTLNDTFDSIPRSLTKLFLSTDSEVPSAEFLSLFQSITHIHVLTLEVALPFTELLREDKCFVWPKGYFTEASGHITEFDSLANSSTGWTFSAQYERNSEPAFLVEDVSPSISVEEGVGLAPLKEEIMNWFQMKESLEFVELICITFEL